MILKKCHLLLITEDFKIFDSEIDSLWKLNSILYSASLLGVFGLRRDLNSKPKVQSPISKLLVWTL